MTRHEPSENEEQLRFVANTVPALLTYIDAGARYVWCNDSYRRWFGYTPESIRGLHLSEVLGAGVWEVIRPYAERALAGEEVTFETRLVYKSGPARDIRATYSPHFDSTGRVRGFVALVNDLTEIKAVETALRRSEHTLARSEAAAHVGSFEVALVATPDTPAGTVRWSDETFRIFGYEPGAFPVTHTSFFEFVHPDDRARVRADSPVKIQRAQHFENEFRIVRRDGEVRVMHTWTDFDRDASGEAVHMIGTCQDITERKRAEEELREADRQKDEFLAMLSHELRNPLAPILSAIEIIESAGPGEEELRATYQAMIARQVQHMKRLLDDLLDVSRVSQGKIQLRKQPVELSSLLLQAVEISQPLILQKQQQLTLNLAQQRLPLTADPTRIVQVFANLLNNAAKFTNPGGHIKLSAALQCGEAVVVVQDDGAGISAELLPRIFDLFVQGTRAFDREQGGLGIGLTMVRTLVKMHGGSVQAASDGPGRGSAFTVRLPLQPEATLPAHPPRPAEAVAASRMNVLVVDDNVDAARAMAHVLQLSGHRVTLAHDGPGALAAAAAESPELVLLDIGLPGMDGYAVAERLRQAGHDRLALVAVTGYGRDEDMRRATEAGFDHHLVKPIDATVLRQVVAQMSARISGNLKS